MKSIKKSAHKISNKHSLSKQSCQQNKPSQPPFSPKYTITDKLLQTVKEIDRLIISLSNRYYADTVLMKLENMARTVSSFTSTRIEGNPLPLTEVKKLLKNAPKNIEDSEREVLNYNRALQFLAETSRKKKLEFGIDLILQLHSFVTDGLLQKYQTGKFRKEPGVVYNPRIGQIVYLPPDFTDVMSLIKELVAFVNSNKTRIDPIILAGLFHRQFVIVHPFVDGNGRTCRLATAGLLATLGLKTFNLFSFENFYNNDVTRYFQKVGAYGDYFDVREDLDFTEWLEYFAEGILAEISRVKVELDKSMQTPDNVLHDAQKKMVAYIRKNGFITDANYAQITSRAKATRVIDFNKLIKNGVIKRKGKGRKTFYVLREE